jgi:hypothetical protein
MKQSFDWSDNQADKGIKAKEGGVTVIIVQSATTLDRRLARLGLLGLLSSAAMVLTHPGAASAADLPPVPPPVTKAPPPAAPVPGHYQFGDIDLAVSGVATAGTSIRTTHPDPVLVPPVNGKVLGIPAVGVGGANIDDGNLNWGTGQPVSSVAKAFVTVDASYRQSLGIFVRAKTWYDYTLATQSVPWGNTAGGYLSGKPLSENGWDPRARAFGIAPQEAYAYAKTRAGGVSFEGRAGDILVPWGLPTMIPGGFAFAMNAVDYAALNRPGVQPEEIFAPTPGAWVRMGLFDRATLEAFSLFTNPRSTLAPCGTLFSGADWAAPGCNSVVFGPFSDPAALAAGFDISRAATPDNHDAQFGVGGSYVAEMIGTRFGAYYSHVDNTTPTAATITSTGAVPFAPGQLGNPQYFLRYAEGVNSFAFNFMTQIKGTTLYGEYVYKPNAPIQYNATDVLNGLLSSVAPTQLRFLYPAGVAPGSVVNAYNSLQVGNLVLGARQVVPEVLGAKALVLGAEFGAKSVYDLPDPSVLRYGRIDVFGLGPVNGVCAPGAPPTQCSLNGYVTPFAWGYRLTSSLRYENVFMPGMNIIPTIGLTHDVSGWSYDGVFNEGRMLLNLKLRAEYSNKYFTEVVWNPAIHNGTYDSLRDRQIVSIATGIKF